MTKRRAPGFSGWQKQLLAELKAIAEQRPDELRITQRPTQGTDGTAVIKISLHTADIPHATRGLEGEDEEFIIRIRSSFFFPPDVDVDHIRFVGFPHVLQGQRLCIYLDSSREWNPGGGIAAFLTRLWDWLTDAAAARFDASTALYHAVGGVLHHENGTPTIVVREAGPTARHQVAHLVVRSGFRYDLTYSANARGHRIPVFTLSTDLPFGATSTLATLLACMNDPYLDQCEGRSPRVAPQSPGFLTTLAASAARNPKEAAQYFILAVPHPAGGPAHLLGGRLPASAVDALRRTVAKRGAAITLDPSNLNPDILIEWCNVSDERQEVTTRRDDSRPVNGFRGKTVHIWGCGGLGSWIAEFIARAGASYITLCDPGVIKGGLLVRQNYVEDDIGHFKAAALARRLIAIRDDLSVDVADGMVPDNTGNVLASDLILDATVSIRVTQYLDALAISNHRRALIAQVATDAKSGTLGILHICAPGSDVNATEIDQHTGNLVTKDGELELYHRLWQEPLDGHELIPTRGCSVPTFHGSSADVAAVAATLVTLLGTHLQSSPVTGTHLIALPHADQGPRHRFIAAGTQGHERRR